MAVPLGLRPLEELDPSVGFISQALFAEADSYSDENYSRLLNASDEAIARDVTDTDSRGFHPTQPLVTDINIMDEGENIVIPYYTGNAADTKDATGPTTIGGNAMFPASGDGTELLFANLLQSRLPTVVSPAVTTVRIVLASNNGDLSAAIPAVTNPDLPNPARLNITVASPVVAGDKAVIYVTGTCLAGDGSLSRVEVTEEFEFESGASGVAFMSDVYFYEVTAITHEGWTSGNIGITVTDESRIVTFTPQDDRLVRFLICEAAKGLVLNTYFGVIATGMNFTFSRDSAVVYDTQFTGRRALLYQDLQGRMGNLAGKTSAANLGLATTEVFTGWQCEVTLNGTRLAATETTFGMAQNLTPTGVISGKPWEEVKPYRGTRNVNIDSSVIYAPQNNFARIFRNNLAIANVRVTLLHRPFAGYPWSTSYIMPQCQVTNLPDTETPEGLLLQNIRIKSYTRQIGLAVPDDVRIECAYSRYNQVREFAA